jgi:hypothetical protein
VISVITCSVDDNRFAAVQDNYRRVLHGAEHEIIRIPDARSLAEGYNRGISASRGEVLIFSHDDVEVLVPLHRLVQERLGTFDVIGVAGTTWLAAAYWGYAGPPHVFGQVAHVFPDEPGHYDILLWAAPAPVVKNIQAMDGLFLAARRAVAESIRFDSDTFDGWHLYDLDFTYRAHLAGMKLAVCCDIPLIHGSYGEFGTPQWVKYAERFGTKFDAQLPLLERARRWQLAHVIASSKQEILEVMLPPHWTTDSSSG